jgi:hypothetical protein
MLIIRGSTFAAGADVLARDAAEVGELELLEVEADLLDGFQPGHERGHAAHAALGVLLAPARLGRLQVALLRSVLGVDDHARHAVVAHDLPHVLLASESAEMSSSAAARRG